MARLRLVDDDVGVAVRPGEFWAKPATIAAAGAIVNSFENAPPVDPEVMRTICRWIHRSDKYGIGDGRGHATATLRVFLESDVNRAALEPIIFSAVSTVVSKFEDHGLALLDALDRVNLLELLATLRSLDLFEEESLDHYMGLALRNKIAKALGAADTPVKKASNMPRSIIRVPEVERDIAVGLELMKLKIKIKDRFEFGRQMRRRFEAHAKATGIALANAGPFCAQAQSVARSYVSKPAIYSRLSWRCLALLSAPSMAPGTRADLERRILSGEKVVEDVILAARGKLPTIRTSQAPPLPCARHRSGRRGRSGRPIASATIGPTPPL